MPRRFLRVLAAGGEAKPFTDGSGRLELARAITSPDNPLTARVMVNRIWHHHFGAGLVTTPSDFGARGELPSHPELLDFLARRFVAGGWSIKALHRLILLSNTYQQRSEGAPRGSRPTRRTACSGASRRSGSTSRRCATPSWPSAGNLDPAMGGRSVDLFQAANVVARRTVYGYVDRYDLDPTYRTFDFPNPDISAPLRPSTTVPQQALFLLNSPFLLDQAKRLANRSDLASIPDPDARIARLYLDLFGRPAQPPRGRAGPPVRRVGRETADDDEAPTPWELYAQVLLMTNEFALVE